MAIEKTARRTLKGKCLCGAVAFEAAGAMPVITKVVGNPVDPCEKAGLALKATNRPPRADEGLLRDVPGIGLVANKVESHGVNFGAVAGYQRVEGGSVSRLAAGDE